MRTIMTIKASLNKSKDKGTLTNIAYREYTKFKKHGNRTIKSCKNYKKKHVSNGFMDLLVFIIELLGFLYYT